MIANAFSRVDQSNCGLENDLIEKLLVDEADQNGSSLVFRKNLNDNAGPNDVRCVGVDTKTRKIVTKGQGDPML